MSVFINWKCKIKKFLSLYASLHEFHYMNDFVDCISMVRRHAFFIHPLIHSTSIYSAPVILKRGSMTEQNNDNNNRSETFRMVLTGRNNYIKLNSAIELRTSLMERQLFDEPATLSLLHNSRHGDKATTLPTNQKTQFRLLERVKVGRRLKHFFSLQWLCVLNINFTD